MDGSRKVVAIVVPHPDDLEILVGHIVLYFLKHNYRVIEILMTWGEYGVINRFKHNGDKLKGKPLRKIRKKENYHAKTAYGYDNDGLPRVETIPLNYIDGHVPVSFESIHNLLQIFESLKPTVIIGPDPVYSIDWHVDHMACAYNTYFAVKNLNNSLFLKSYCLYQSYKPNLFLPIYQENWVILQKAHLAHKSQMRPVTIKILLTLHRTLLIFYHRKKTRLRRINLQKISITGTMGKISTLVDWIIYFLLHNNKPDNTLYSPTPEQLGLTIEPL